MGTKQPLSQGRSTQEFSQVSRRGFVKTAAVGAAGVAALPLVGALSACAKEPAPETSSPDAAAAAGLPTAATASNFNIMPESTTVVGTTYENLLAAITGETGATTKYAAFAKVAESEGFPQLARLFNCTSDAEKIHIELEFALASKINPDTKRPEPPTVDTHQTDINLIFGANGEIYETSDMYPAFIKVAQDENNAEAVQIFTRAKLAEAYHAERYLEAYNNIDKPDDDKYYLCPVCGFIHKGDDFESCPICGTAKASFKEY
ncbi:MAG: rubrerythrin family protein [Coriobacteriales bacterium]|jgi:rubrerythrin|nr:rubrerythrin family protein [Coriobacteriales bacterium]